MNSTRTVISRLGIVALLPVLGVVSWLNLGVGSWITGVVMTLAGYVSFKMGDYRMYSMSILVAVLLSFGMNFLKYSDYHLLVMPTPAAGFAVGLILRITRKSR